jgi:hypothetical protein
MNRPETISQERNRMSQSHAWSVGILASMLALGSSGCGGSSDGLPREAVSGSVTLESQPLAKGTIQFAPTSDKVPTSATAGIVDGKYSIPRSEGLVPGTYKVAISSVTEAAAPKAVHGLPGPTRPPAKNLVPKQYNTASTLTAEVKSGEANTFPFEITKNEVEAQKK